MSFEKWAIDSGLWRKALAKAIGALNIVADVENNPDEDNYLVTFMDGTKKTIDNEVACGLAQHFAVLERELTTSPVRPAW